MIPYFKSTDRAFTLLHGDCIELLKPVSYTHLDVYKRQQQTLSLMKELSKDRTPAEEAAVTNRGFRYYYAVSYTHLFAVPD